MKFPFLLSHILTGGGQHGVDENNKAVGDVPRQLFVVENGKLVRATFVPLDKDFTHFDTRLKLPDGFL